MFRIDENGKTYHSCVVFVAAATALLLKFSLWLRAPQAFGGEDTSGPVRLILSHDCRFVHLNFESGNLKMLNLGLRFRNRCDRIPI